MHVIGPRHRWVVWSRSRLAAARWRWRRPPSPRKRKRPRRPTRPRPRSPAPRPMGDVSKADCLTRHEEAQVARRERRLLDTRTALRICSGASCPAAIRADCVDWLDQVAHSLPSVVVTARARGADILAVKVFIDGKLATETAERLRAGDRSRAAQVPLRVAALAGDRARGAGQRGRQGPADRRRVRAAAADRGAAGGALRSAQAVPPRAIRLRVRGHRAGRLATLAYFGGTGIYDANQLESSCMSFCKTTTSTRCARS